MVLLRKMPGVPCIDANLFERTPIPSARIVNRVFPPFYKLKDVVKLVYTYRKVQIT